MTETNKLSNHLFLIFKEELHAFFISSAIFKLVKNQANSKQHSELELLLFKSYSRTSLMLLPKNNRKYPLKNTQKNKSVCFHEIMQLIKIKMETKMKKRSHR